MARPRFYSYVTTRSGVSMPWIQVRLGNPSTGQIIPQNLFALLDSGSDVCMCSEEIAAYIGVMQTDESKKKKKEFIAINGQKFVGYKTEMILYACGNSYTCPFFVFEKLPSIAPVILGQNGFFSTHDVMFSFSKKAITITPVDK